MRKYYKNHSDEHKLIKNKFKNLILSKDRINGIRKLEKSNFDMVILDDGLQDYRLKKDLNIVCFHRINLLEMDCFAFWTIKRKT